ncbi:M56 family metallopeptidase [Streptomyces sp. TRM68367]|uniref:M56 family metallopeptidase n=1 Tax=Streptomyces sp. TRM68367 TaxID=2758415 RepID=UPI00165C4C96|nr:M56 family metallopeptidase [Streptomyces sp. TRM68367]MBC9723854.1 M56 family metallopeptidase [Streptomyces sp. TRM68367]
MIGAAALDRGDRAFWTLVAVSVVIRAVVVYVACCLTMALAWQVGHRGTGVLLSGGVWAGTVLLTLSVSGGVRSAVHLWKGLRATRILGQEVRARAHDDGTATDTPEVRHAAERAGLADRVTVVVSKAPFAFTYGLFRPHVAVSSGLATAATRREIDAVLAHEAEHVRGRDPLRALITGVLATRHFALPLLSHLRAVFVADRELTADRRAVAHCGTPAVAGALLKVSGMPGWALAVPASAMGTPELLDARITQLEAGHPPRLAPPARWRVAASVAGIAAYVWALAGSAALIAATPLTCIPA